ncbi:MAG: hypothetical protein AAFV93_16320 [Chloroflexota bacterium]
MELSLIFTLSCVMTTIAMIIYFGFLLIFARYGGQGIQQIFNRFFGDEDDANNQQDTQRQAPNQQPAVASSQSLRQRARNLDFPAPASGVAGATFSAQGASGGRTSNYPDFPPPQNTGFQAQASLRPSGQATNFNAQPAQSLGQTSSFQPSTPSLSPSRPFQHGSERLPNQNQQNFGQQGFGQQQSGFNTQGQQGFQPPQQPLQGGNFGQNQQPLQSGNFGQNQQLPNQRQQNFGQSAQGFGQNQPLPPNQGQQNFGQNQPLPPNQGQQGFGQQQGNFNAQSQGQQPPQFNGLGQNRPPLRSRPNPGNTQYDRPIGGRDRRQGDDRDYIYDDRNSGNNFVDDVGDFIDNF